MKSKIEKPANAGFIKIIKGVILIAAIAISCYGIDSKKAAAKKTKPESKGFAVIELFTSEGCSSCPSADELVRRVCLRIEGMFTLLAFTLIIGTGWDGKMNLAKPLFLTGKSSMHIIFL